MSRNWGGAQRTGSSSGGAGKAYVLQSTERETAGHDGGSGRTFRFMGSRKPLAFSGLAAQRSSRQREWLTRF